MHTLATTRRLYVQLIESGKAAKQMEKHFGRSYSTFRGQEFRAGWPLYLAACQDVKEFKRGKVKYARIPRGKDWPKLERRTTTVCGDCGAMRGELHAIGCDLEQCPLCKGQLISCNCFNLDLK